MLKKKFDRFFAGYLRTPALPDVEAFESRHLRTNLLRSLFIHQFCLLFYLPLLILNFLRWKNGIFETNPEYIIVLVSHVLLGFFIYPYYQIKKNRAAIETEAFPLSKSRFLLLLSIGVLSYILLTISGFALHERASLAPFAIHLVLVNYVVVTHPRILLFINAVIFFMTLLFGCYFAQRTGLDFFVFFIECSALITAVYAGAVFRYNASVKSYIYERQLQKQNTIIQKSLTEQFERQIAEVEMSALRAQMNPHFLFNALNSIKLYVVKNDSRTAALYLTKFSKLIRSILNNSKSQMVSIAAEVEALELYIQMEQFRFNFKFDYKIEIDEDVDKDFTEIPPMLMQPFVENAIWHGLMYKHSEEGNLLICIRRKKGNLEFIIEDDGIGRAKSQELKSAVKTKHKSLGLQITADRLAVANKLYGTEGTVKIIDKKDETGKATGTKVVFKLPREE